MSMKAYDFWRWHGLSPELAMHLATIRPNVPNIYEVKKQTDSASHSGFSKTIGVKQS